MAAISPAKWGFETDKTLTRVDVCMLLHVGFLVKAFAAKLARERPWFQVKLNLILIKLKYYRVSVCINKWVDRVELRLNCLLQM